MMLRKHYQTIVLSDIHLGSEHSRTDEVTKFLKSVDCNRLILNGDIIDGWQLRKSGSLPALVEQMVQSAARLSRKTLLFVVPRGETSREERSLLHLRF